MREEVKVVEIQALGNEKPQKTNAGYSFPVRYILEDGRIIDTFVSKRLLRDAKKEQAELPRKVNNVIAMFHDGKYVGTQYSYTLGARGLEERKV